MLLLITIYCYWILFSLYFSQTIQLVFCKYNSFRLAYWYILQTSDISITPYYLTTSKKYEVTINYYSLFPLVFKFYLFLFITIISIYFYSLLSVAIPYYLLLFITIHYYSLLFITIYYYLLLFITIYYYSLPFITIHYY